MSEESLQWTYTSSLVTQTTAVGGGLETEYTILVHICSVWLKPDYFLVAYKGHTQLEKYMYDAIACLDQEWSHSIERAPISTVPQTTPPSSGLASQTIVHVAVAHH